MSKRTDEQTNKSAYAQAGVDLDLGNQVKSGIHALVKGTHGPSVLGKTGGFGGLFSASFPDMTDPVLVSSIDGVGTKLKLAFATGQHFRMGQDIVNHCVNDIAVMGARPLFFLDYIGSAKLDPEVFRELLKGMAKACREAGCALIGGETAQMPGMYHPGHYDLVGTIVGVVDRPKILDGSTVRPGDIILGLPSSGLHTNGYALAQRVLLEQMGLSLDHIPAGATRPLSDLLTAVHKNYLPLLSRISPGIVKALAHITGGGLIDNIPRSLPADCDAVIETKRWRVPPLFKLIQQGGSISDREMHHTFNMGIGMTAVVSREHAIEAQGALRARPIGEITRGDGQVRLLF